MRIIWDLDGTLFDTWDAHVFAIKEVGRIVNKKELSLLHIIKNQGNTIDRTLFMLFGRSFFAQTKSLYKHYFKLQIDNMAIRDSAHIVYLQASRV